MSPKSEVIVVINPGSTSTKLALWSRLGCVNEITVRHEANKLTAKVVDQFDYRRELIDSEILDHLQGYEVVGIVGRGGLLKPLEGGTYAVNNAMLAYLKSPECGNHASNLGALLADYYAKRFSVPAYIVDPVVVDELADVARLSGVKWIPRKSRGHALNIKAVVRRAARELGKAVIESRFIVAHLGGGTSIAAVDGGRMIDVNDGLLGMGPFSPERSGALPIGPLVEHCFNSGRTKEQIIGDLSRKAGLVSYCGSSDLPAVLEKMRNGDKEAELAVNAMIYQDSKEIGAMGAVLGGRVDAVILTGGQVYNTEIVEGIRHHVAFIAPILVYPGEGELEALAEGAFRALDGVEAAKDYS